MGTEVRTRVYPTEARNYCNKCAVFLDFLDQGQEKNPNLTYLSKEEFEKITDHRADDSVLSVFTVNQILSVLLAVNDLDGIVKYFNDQKDMTSATVKFFGEMVPTGMYQKFVSPEDRSTQRFQALHQCNNPSCKFEEILPAEYPFVEQTVGRMIRSPEELQHPDDVIKNVMKHHVGSTVTPNMEDIGEDKVETSAEEEGGEEPAEEK